MAIDKPAAWILLDGDELDAGSDPDGATSIPLRVLARHVNSPTSVLLTWNTLTGRTYRVEFKNHLNPDTWQPLGPERVANGASLTMTDETGGQTQRFYRILLVD